MALKKTIESNIGMVVNDAYIKITNIGGTKELIGFTVKGYVNKEASDAEKLSIFQQDYEFKPIVTEDSCNYHKQAYEYLKTLPEYVDAVDC